MTDQETAKELVKKFTSQKVKVAIKQRSGAYKEYEEYMSLESAKKCALICISEMKKVENQILEGVPTDFVYTYVPNLDKVKQGIDKL